MHTRAHTHVFLVRSSFLAHARANTHTHTHVHVHTHMHKSSSCLLSGSVVYIQPSVVRVRVGLISNRWSFFLLGGGWPATPWGACCRRFVEDENFRALLVHCNPQIATLTPSSESKQGGMTNGFLNTDTLPLYLAAMQMRGVAFIKHVVAEANKLTKGNPVGSGATDGVTCNRTKFEGLSLNVPFAGHLWSLMLGMPLHARPKTGQSPSAAVAAQYADHLHSVAGLRPAGLFEMMSDVAALATNREFLKFVSTGASVGRDVDLAALAGNETNKNIAEFFEKPENEPVAKFLQNATDVDNPAYLVAGIVDVVAPVSSAAAALSCPTAAPPPAEEASNGNSDSMTQATFDVLAAECPDQLKTHAASAGCGMHISDKVMSFGIGKLYNTVNGKAINAAPDALGLFQAAHDACTVFSYGQNYSLLERTCKHLGIKCIKPKGFVTGTTRVGAAVEVYTSLHKMQLAIQFIVLNTNKHKPSHNDAKLVELLSFSEEDWYDIACVAGIGSVVGSLSFLAQIENRPVGTMFELLVKDVLQDLRGKTLEIVDHASPTGTRLVAVTSLGSVARTVLDRAIWKIVSLLGQGQLRTTLFPVIKSLDLRHHFFFKQFQGDDAIVSADEMEQGREALEARYYAWGVQARAHEQAHPSQAPAPAGGPFAVAAAAAPTTAYVPPTPRTSQGPKRRRTRLVFKMCEEKEVAPAGNVHVAWSRQASNAEFKRVHGSFAAYPFDVRTVVNEYGYVNHKPDVAGEMELVDFVYVDMYKIYNKMSNEDPTGEKYGYLPAMATTFLSRNSASSFVERCNSVLKQVHSDRRSELAPATIEMLVFLRMNKRFFQFMNDRYDVEFVGGVGRVVQKP